jgi:AraC-like DNA-binding protein
MRQNRHSDASRAPLVPIALASPVLGLAEDRESGDLIVPHQHDSAQLIHAAKGVMTVITEDGLWVVPPQRAVWVPAFTTHSIRMTGRVEIRTIYLDPSLRPIDSEACCVVRVSPLLHASIMRVIGFRQPYASAGRESRIVDVIIDEVREAPTAPLHLPLPRDVRARRVADAFRERPGDRRTASEWARVAGASERTVERLFRSEVGMTLGRWQQQARLLRALEILAGGESVTTVALEVGFETPSAFIAMFKRAMGTTPARYFHSQSSG